MLLLGIATQATWLVGKKEVAFVRRMLLVLAVAAVLEVLLASSALFAGAQTGCNDYEEPPVFVDYGAQGVWEHHWVQCADTWYWTYWSGPY
jgi:hypothetical protein